MVAVGTGQAIKNAANGDGDVLFVHDKPSEEKFVAEGNGVRRFDVMCNEFILVAPANDPARITGSKDIVAAFKRIAETKAPFVSRGDDSGTHKSELRLWKDASVDVKAASGTWYREAGSGMGATINSAMDMGAYVFTDRATWSSSKNRGEYKIAVQGDNKLFNQYGVILVNPARHPKVKKAEGQAFIDWLLSTEGQNTIRSFKINGEQQFSPRHLTELVTKKYPDRSRHTHGGRVPGRCRPLRWSPRGSTRLQKLSAPPSSRGRHLLPLDDCRSIGMTLDIIPAEQSLDDRSGSGGMWRVGHGRPRATAAAGERGVLRL